ncbi:RagB/SusD family nutrient uptake outer membrane protein [Bacteroides sp. K03]|uniref:RagB/SusD family nutrient uptake outer membrane protein n=1 Tax=Bacteroides TaxID=816 RepID=UPI001C8BC25C|nr:MULTISPECIES: RagB/SusD family nutrient uptake outer membrane protein [Bacteroides]MBX9188864.1 RagB/SusD family nutrient uptake outer membrane protein [Bacteroides sp. K03]
MKKRLFNTKKKLVILSVVALSMGMTSCADWLEMPSYTSADSETVFKNEEAAELFVTGCYRGIIPTEMVYQLMAGETVTHSSEDGTTNNGKYNICNWFYDSTSPYTVTTLYNEEYGAIEATNIAIKNLNMMPETTKRNSLLGEALALRAFAYLNLISIYGDVPANWQPLEDMDPDDESTFYPKRTSRDIIYDRIVSDLQTAANYMPWFEESGFATTERLTKQSTLALLARVALYAGGYSLRWNLETNDPATLKVSRRSDEARVRELYQIADKACNDIIEHGQNSLVQAEGGMSGFQNLWYNYCQRKFTSLNKEILWSLAQYGATTNSKFGLYAHPGTRGGTYGSRKAMQFILPTYYLSFEEGDARRDVTCTSYSIYFLEGGASNDTWVDVGTTYSCIMSGKFRIPWCVAPESDANKRNVNIPIIRYSDVLLMYAETQNYLNGAPTQPAKDALKEIRDRAGVGSLPIPTDPQEFEDALAQERKWEFGGELSLRTDLIRMGRIAKELAATKQAMKDLSDRKNKYADVSVYRLYKFHKDAQTYGDTFLAIDYIDLTDDNEIAVAKAVPTNKAEYDAFQTKLAEIVRAHGIAVNAGDKWYPVNMFEAYTSTFNGNARKAVGFGKGFNALQIGKIIYQKPTGSAENGGKYPDWIEAADGSDGLYYGYKENCSELLPFAAKSAGHPLVDNPNLTQHPGYK